MIQPAGAGRHTLPAKYPKPCVLEVLSDRQKNARPKPRTTKLVVWRTDTQLVYPSPDAARIRTQAKAALSLSNGMDDRRFSPNSIPTFPPITIFSQYAAIRCDIEQYLCDTYEMRNMIRAQIEKMICTERH